MRRSSQLSTINSHPTATVKRKNFIIVPHLGQPRKYSTGQSFDAHGQRIVETKRTCGKSQEPTPCRLAEAAMAPAKRSAALRVFAGKAFWLGCLLADEVHPAIGRVIGEFHAGRWSRQNGQVTKGDQLVEILREPVFLRFEELNGPV